MARKVRSVGYGVHELLEDDVVVARFHFHREWVRGRPIVNGWIQNAENEIVASSDDPKTGLPSGRWWAYFADMKRDLLHGWLNREGA